MSPPAARRPEGFGAGRLGAGLLGTAGLHTSACYVSYFAVMGVHMPFWPLWLGDWGLTPAEVGFYGACAIGVRIVAGILLPAAGDWLAARRGVFVTCIAAAFVLFLLHPAITTRPVLFAATLATGAAFAAATPLLETLGVAAARDHGFAYAQARGIGSLGYLGANLIAGAWIARAGSGVALWWLLAFLAATALLGLRHPGGAGIEARPPRLGEIRRLVLDPTFALFTATVAFTQGSHAVLYAYGSLHWRDLGFGADRIGALWALSVAVEVLFMVTVGTRVVARLGPVGALALACAAGILRFGLLATDPVGFLVWPLQMLHALTFALGHLGAIAFISQAVPARFGAAAQGSVSALGVGLVMTAGMLAAAAIYPQVGGGAYLIGAASSALGLAATALLHRRWTGGELSL